MSEEDIFKLEIKLEKISLIAIAAAFWNRVDIQQTVSDHFMRGKPNWSEIIESVAQQVDLLPLPDKLLQYVKNYIPLVGRRVYNWIDYVRGALDLPIKYASQTYWTPYGIVNKVKIVDEIWLKETEDSRVNHNNFDFWAKSLRLAALFARENFILENLDQIRDHLKDNAYLSDIEKSEDWTVYGVLAASLVRSLSRTPKQAREVLRNFNVHPNNLPAKKLFLKSLKANYVHPARYFWDKLTINEKNDSVISAARQYLKHRRDSDEDVDETEMEMVVFLLNQMSVIQLKEFVVSTRFAFLFKSCLKIWPYQDICVNLLNQNWTYDPSHIETLLMFVMKYFSSTKKRMNLRNKCVYRIIFQKLLERTLKEKKLKLFVNNENHENFYYLYKNFDVVGLCLILNDPDLREHKSGMLNNFENIFKILILEEKYEDLDIFLKNFYSEKEKELFKKKWNYSTLFLMSGKFESVDKHLTWLYVSENERLLAKEQIDPLEICQDFVMKNRLDLADKFLEWRLDTEESRNKVKRAIYESDKFLRDEIYRIWCCACPPQDFNTIQGKCSEFLIWFLESDAAVTEFRKTKLIKNEFFIVKYWKNLSYGDSFKDVDKFLLYCLRTPEEIAEIKGNIANNISWWINTFMLSEFKMMKALIDWIFVDESLSKHIIGNYLNSTKGVSLCVSIFKNYNGCREQIADFFNTWFNRSLTDVNILEMKKNLEFFDKTVASDYMKLLILKLLSKRKEGSQIQVRDLPRNIDNWNTSGETNEDDSSVISDPNDTTVSDESIYYSSDFSGDDSESEHDNSESEDNEQRIVLRALTVRLSAPAAS